METTKRIQLIRLAADDELTDEQVAEFEHHLASAPEDRLAVDYERELRRAVSRVMSSDIDVPAGLRDRVDRAWRVYEDRRRARQRRAASVETGTGWRVLPDTGREPQRSRRSVRPRFRFAPSGLAAGILFLIAVSIIASIFSEERFKAVSRLTPGEKAAFENLMDQTNLDLRTDADSVHWLSRDRIDAGEAVLARHFDARQARVVSLGSAFEYQTASGILRGGFDYQGIWEDGHVPGSAVVQYRENQGPGRTLLLWMVPVDQLDRALLGKLDVGQPYQLVGGNGLLGLSRCYAWTDGEIVRFVRLSIADADVTTGGPGSLAVARALGLPDGKPVTYP